MQHYFGAKATPSERHELTQVSVTVSVISHRQGRLVRTLLDDLDHYCAGTCEVILTNNVPEVPDIAPAGRRNPLTVVENAVPRGFAANHNAAFRSVHTPYFCVINPDVRLRSNPFPDLISVLDDSRIGVVAPLVRNSSGAIENSARKFPTPKILARKALGLKSEPAPHEAAKPGQPDWVAGMFMLFRSDLYNTLGGFDEGYFLYYEDIHLCARIRIAGMRVVLEPRIEIIHDAQRASHRNLRHAWWHATSILRFFRSEAYRELGRRGMR
jgi:N-acetylglucosaminyl-diphospho-decaprenol L-rhamnosyltransferase